MTLFSDSSSLAALVSDAAENVHLELDDGELADISVVAECARPGRPKFDLLLADEIEMSRGALIVGCMSTILFQFGYEVANHFRFRLRSHWVECHG